MRQMSRFFKWGFFLYLITVATEWRLSRSTAKQHRWNPRFVMDFLYFNKKWRNFQVPYFIFSYSRTFPVFKDPWEPCIKVYRNAASIYKFSGGLGGPLTPRRFFRSWLAPRPIRWHFRLVKTLTDCDVFKIQLTNLKCQNKDFISFPLFLVYRVCDLK